VAFAWAHASLGLFGARPPTRLAGKAVPRENVISVVATLTDDLTRPLTAQLQVSLDPWGSARPWDDRVLEGPAAQLTLPAGKSVKRTWTIELDVPEGRYEAWLWLREPSGGTWVGTGQRRLTRTAIRVPRTAPILRARVPTGIVLTEVHATTEPGDPTPVSVTAVVDNSTGAPKPVGLRWGLLPAVPADQSTWAAEPLAPSGGVRWVNAAPGKTSVTLSGMSLIAPGAYHVRVQLLPGPAPSSPFDAAAGTVQAPLALDEVLVTNSLEVDPVRTPGLVRPSPPDGPLVITKIGSGPRLAARMPAQVTISIENLGDVRADGSVFAIFAPIGSAQPWSDEVAASAQLPVSVAPGTSASVLVRLPAGVPAGTYELSAWVHGATAKTEATHVDGVISTQPVMVAP
jgi:hypothetical protein